SNGAGSYNSNSADPTMSRTTTRVLSGLRLDYNNSVNCYVMVRNVSTTSTDSVTLKWTTADGTSAPAPTSFSIGPSTQKLVEWDAYQYLNSGAVTTGVVTVSWTGNSADIVAGACSESGSNGLAIAAPSLEPDPGDGNQLVGTFFQIDPVTGDEVVLTNVSTNTVQAGGVLLVAGV